MYSNYSIITGARVLARQGKLLIPRFSHYQSKKLQNFPVPYLHLKEI